MPRELSAHVPTKIGHAAIEKLDRVAWYDLAHQVLESGSTTAPNA